MEGWRERRQGGAGVEAQVRRRATKQENRRCAPLGPAVHPPRVFKEGMREERLGVGCRGEVQGGRGRRRGRRQGDGFYKPAE